MNVPTFNRRWPRAIRVRLERNDFKWNAVNFSDFFGKFPVDQVCRIVVRSSQATSDNLLAEQLRHEWTQSDDVRDRSAIPTLSQHRNTHDATHVATGRMQRPFEFRR